MATYSPIRPQPDQWADIPASATYSRIVAIGGPLWISDDPVPDVTTAMLLQDGASYPVRPGRSLKCFLSGRGGQLRRMDHSPDGSELAAEVAGRLPISATQAGAVGDGITDDTAALEAIPPGQEVDLLGRVYAVSELPEHTTPINGAFAIGSDVYAMRQRPLEHPLAVDLRAIKSDGRTHYWGFGIVHDATTDITCAFWNRAHRHEPSIGGPLICARSYDRGASFNRESTIYSVTDRDVADGAFGALADGRIGGVIATREVTGANYRTAFVYSDDGGETWATNEDIIAPGVGIFPYGRLHSYTGGHIAFGYFSNSIVYVRSEDNGATWTRGIALAGGGALPTPTEPSVVQISGGRWLMFIRPQIGNLFVARSADGLSWTGLTDTGIPLGPNPTYAIYDGGQVFVYLAARNIQRLRSQRNALQVIRADANAIYNGADLKSYGLRFALDMESSMLGYVCEAKIEDDYIWIATASETETGSAYGAPATIYIGSTRPRPAASPAMAKEARRNRNLLHNQSLGHWTRGPGLADQTVRRMVADRWIVDPSGATYTCERVDVPRELARLMPHAPRYGLRLETSVHNDFLTLRQDQYGEEVLWSLSGAVLSYSVWGRGVMATGPTSPYVQINFNYGGGGSAPDIASGGRLAVSDFGGLWHATGRVRTPDIVGKTFGSAPFFRFVIGSSVAAAWDVEIYGIKLEIGEAATPLEVMDHAAERLLLDQYVERQDYAQYKHIGVASYLTTNTTSTTLQYAPKVRNPVISLPDPADFGLRGPTVATPQSITATEIGLRSAALECVYDALPAGNSGHLRAVAEDGLSILIDAEVAAA